MQTEFREKRTSHLREHAGYGSSFLRRRRLLQIGGLGCLGLNLAGLLRAETAAAASPVRPHSAARVKSCILLFYYGGPSHLDTWDMKPDSPREIRGEFRTTATAVPGLRICEHLPRCARVIDKLAVVRSLHHPMRRTTIRPRSRLSAAALPSRVTSSFSRMIPTVSRATDRP